jgi:hypothetical protein
LGKGHAVFDVPRSGEQQYPQFFKGSAPKLLPCWSDIVLLFQRESEVAINGNGNIGNYHAER